MGYTLKVESTGTADRYSVCIRGGGSHREKQGCPLGDRLEQLGGWR